MFEKMVQSIQTDEARHAQIGEPVLAAVIARDPERAQYLVDKWFWRSWHFFAIVTGFAMDYLSPVSERPASFRDFMQEWIVEQFDRSLKRVGLERPWYWPSFIESLGTYHHMVYATAYTYRATVWFDMALPGPAEREWLLQKYPDTWPQFDPIWTQITDRCRRAGPDVEWYTHGVTPVGFCDLCQIVLSAGTPQKNESQIVKREGKTFAFCSEPCRWLFEREPERYASHRDVVKRILSGEAPANLIALLREYFGLSEEVWGKDLMRGKYPWLGPQGPLDGA
jgi:toluene monooxygenase system protein A